MARNLSRSYAYCERVARREAGNFYHAFRILPAAQRRAMCALYAFLRVADDLADGPGNPEAKALLLAAWRRRLGECLDGHYSHRLHAALHDTVRTFAVPSAYLEAVLDGVEMDLRPCVYKTFAELYTYCYRVASAVGLCCIHVWGFSDERAKIHAESAGIAFQLTNICRDLAEDAARGRVYLPQDDLERFEYSPDQLMRGERNEQFLALMHFETGRARQYYVEALPLHGMLSREGRAVFGVMWKTYRGLLEAIVRRDFDVFSGRVSLSRWHKLRLALSALPIRWGWVRP